MVDILKTGVEQFPVVLTASGFDISPYQKGPYTYLWTFDDGSQLTGAIVSYTWKAGGYKTVKLLVTDSFSGLSSNFSFTVRIITLSEVLREISISPTSVTLNTGDTQQFTATVPYGMPDLAWSAVDGTIDSTGLFTATNGGTGSVTVALAGNPVINASAVVTIIPLPVFPLSIPDSFYDPIEIDTSNQYLYANNGTDIKKINISNGSITTFVIPSAIQYVIDFKFHSNGLLYVLGINNLTDLAYIYTMNSSGIFTEILHKPTNLGVTNTFNSPYAIEVDSTASNFYIGDTGNAVVYKITSAGVITTLAGTYFTPGNIDGLPGTGQLATPTSLVFDSLYTFLIITDDTNRNIRKVDISNGNLSTLTGSGTFTLKDINGKGNSVYLSEPEDIQRFSDTLFYVADQDVGQIKSINLTTTEVLTTGLPYIPSFGTPSIHGLAIDNINNKIYSSTNNFIYSLNYLNYPISDIYSIIDVDPNGLIYYIRGIFGDVSSHKENGIYSLDPSLLTKKVLTNLLDLNSGGSIGEICDIKYHSNGNIYTISSIAGNTTNFIIHSITKTGTVTAICNPPRGSSTINKIELIGGFEVDSTASNFYISDTSNAVIYKVTTSSTITLFAGTFNTTALVDGLPGTGCLQLPTGLAFNSTFSTLLVCCHGDSRISSINVSNGYSTILVGSNPIDGGVNGDTDGVGYAVRLDAPTAIRRYSDSLYYFTDTNNKKVKTLNPSTKQVISIYTAPSASQGLIGIAVDAVNNHIYTCDANLLYKVQ